MRSENRGEDFKLRHHPFFSGHSPLERGKPSLFKCQLELKEKLEHVMKMLTERERKILEMRFGLVDGCDDRSHQSDATQYGE